MESININDEQNQTKLRGANSNKMRAKDRNRSQTSINDQDINDPENLDYEDIDDSHQSAKIDDNNQLDRFDNPVKNTNNQDKLSNDTENNATNEKFEKTNDSLTKDEKAIASDEGELDDVDLEDGEIHDPSTSKTKLISNDDQVDEAKQQINHSGQTSSHAKVQCRFFLQGRCHWGTNCKYIHPTNDSIKHSTGNTIEGSLSTKTDTSPPGSASLPTSQSTNTSWISPQATSVAPQFFPNSILAAPVSGISMVTSTGTESAWERGLRSAKTLREQSMRRKQQDKDFNDKKFNLTIRDAATEKDLDDHHLQSDKLSPLESESNHKHKSNYVDQHGYPDRYTPYSSMPGSSSNNSHYNHHRTNNSSRHPSSPVNDNIDRRTRYVDNHNDMRHNNRNRKDKDRPTAKRDDALSYKRNSSQQQHQQHASGSYHSVGDQSCLGLHGNRRADTWYDPWDRSRNHVSKKHRSSGTGREPSYSSSSRSSTSSSRSSRSRSTSSSSRSRSRSRSRPKRRSPSVTRTTRSIPIRKSSEPNKNGNDKKSNGNKRNTSPSPGTATTTTATGTNKFLPGRQISSHTLKKVEKLSNSSNTSRHTQSKDHHGKDSDKKSKQKQSRNLSTSSSSSSNSDTNRVLRDSSSSSSDSSSSENEIQTSTKIKTDDHKTTATSSHSNKSLNRQLLSPSGGGKNTNSKLKNESLTRDTSKTKKRRDTSSSTGSINTTKKSKLNTDSHKTSTDTSNAENSDTNKKKEKQKLIKEVQKVEKLINQRSTKTTS